MKRVLVYGVRVAGRAVVDALTARGIDVITADDQPVDGLDAIAPRGADLAHLVGAVDTVVPAPGVPEHHPLIAEAQRQGRVLRSELDLAAEWEAARPEGPRPFLAITGTDGKTTVTTLTTAMLVASGLRAVDAGNTDVPLVRAIDDPAVDVFVVEASSFRLRWLTCFRPRVGTWLNLAPDHLDWHGTLEAYAAAKARIWEFQGPDDVAVAAVADRIVMAHTAGLRARVVTFGGPGSGADFRVDGAQLVGPDGPLLGVEELWRRFPHDLTNALAAAATALHGGATPDGVAQALRAFRGVPHRIELVAERDGVRWFDDSKATTPHAALTAIRGFSSVVLVAGGRNKDLDLSVLRSEASRIRAVVALGEAAGEVIDAFAGCCPTVEVTGMDDAVAAAARLARPGDAVLLSPACTSLDQYSGYAERGDDFARAVRRHLGEP